ncbi:Predicted dehydrogenase [Nakamurella panacisegetis]|uniref:Predicted dehydrogenase n=1 Tax=Nakamurella panacisegetis TaxID=1090615 RepID=A0A1H0LGP5_9ACTN|nr:Gfo/Idh/MocA family oxidoreductase [Nakamurella panacisegetis]SDO67407.1 Predicted dehydrogenase [Nakamurella panacisegetis]
MNNPIRWAIWATGAIADKFAADLPLVADAELLAIGSRSMANANAFGDRHGIPRRYAGLPDLLSDGDIDVVYIASPASAHCGDALTVIAAGRHVLVEKPFTLTLADAHRVVAAAGEGGVFLMEAMWSRFLPYFDMLADLLGQGVIGDIRYLEADFGMRFPADNRLFTASTGGGALFDLGVYPLQLAHAVLGVPTSLLASGLIGPTGVDLTTQIALRYPQASASLQTSLTVPLRNEARLVGADREIVLPKFLHCPDEIVIGHRDMSGGDLVVDERLPANQQGNGLHYEVAAVHSCIRAGSVEHPLMPWAATLEVMAMLDQTAGQIGLHVG